MKRKKLIIVSTLGMFILFSYLLQEREIQVCNTIVEIYENGEKVK